MAITNWVLLSQLAGYVVELILSLCLIIPIALHEREFNGHCLLFSTGSWQESDGQLLVNWASIGYCNYVIVCGIVMFLISTVQIYKYSMLLYQGIDSTFLSAFIDVLAAIFLGAFTIIGACMITLGFMTWCENIMERFPSCDAVVGQDIDQKDKIETSGFYVELGTAQFGAWAAFVTCVAQGVFAMLKLIRYHQLENIRVSMYIERQRLVNEGREFNEAPTPPLTD